MSLPAGVLRLAPACASAVSLGCGLWVIGRVLVSVPARGARQLPVWVRWLLPLATALGGWAQHLLPPARLQAQSRLLARCDLDTALPVADWIGLRLLLSGSAGLLVAVLTGYSAPGRGIAGVGLGVFASLCVWGATWLWLRRRLAARERLVLKELPAYLDVLTVCVEAGTTLTSAMRIAVEKSPRTPLRSVFERVLGEIRVGRTRVDALGAVAKLYDIECLTALAGALVQSEGAGMSLGGVLRAQAQQRATERQLRAERSALQAPVKMLGPLVLCVFPCTFIVIAVPVVVRMYMEGLG